MFFEVLYFGQFLSFYTMQLEPPKNSTIGTWAKPLSRMAPHLFGHTKIYNMGVSISNIYHAYNKYPQNVAPTMICHVPPWT